jgi:hypothetical protein
VKRTATIVLVVALLAGCGSNEKNTLGWKAGTDCYKAFKDRGETPIDAKDACLNAVPEDFGLDIPDTNDYMKFMNHKQDAVDEAFYNDPDYGCAARG